MLHHLQFEFNVSNVLSPYRTGPALPAISKGAHRRAVILETPPALPGNRKYFQTQTFHFLVTAGRVNDIVWTTYCSPKRT